MSTLYKRTVYVMLGGVVLIGLWCYSSVNSFLKARSDFINELETRGVDAKLADGLKMVAIVHARCRIAKQAPTDQDKRSLEALERFSNVNKEYVVANENLFDVQERNGLPWLIKLLPYYSDRYRQLREASTSKARIIKQRVDDITLALQRSQIDCIFAYR